MRQLYYLNENNELVETLYYKSIKDMEIGEIFKADNGEFQQVINKANMNGVKTISCKKLEV